MLPVGGCAGRLVGAQRGGHDPVRGAQRGDDPPRRPGARCGSTGSRRRGGAWTSCLASTGWLVMAKGANGRSCGRRRDEPLRVVPLELLERLECGIVLQGTEVKSLRDGGVQLKDGFAAIQRRRAVAAQRPHPAVRARRAGTTTSPSGSASCCSSARRSTGSRPGERAGAHARADADLLLGPRAKVEIALARGKDVHDKRETIKKRDRSGRCSGRCARSAAGRLVAAEADRVLDVGGLHAERRGHDQPEVDDGDDQAVAGRDAVVGGCSSEREPRCFHRRQVSSPPKKTITRRIGLGTRSSGTSRRSRGTTSTGPSPPSPGRRRGGRRGAG